MAKYNSCTSLTLNSIDATCDESRASIKRVLVCPKEDILAIGVNYDSVGEWSKEDYEKNTLVNNIVPKDGKFFVEFYFRRNTGSYTSTYTGDNTTGSQVVTTEVNLQFSKAEYQKRLEFQKLTGRPCVMIIEDNYGQYIALGVDAPVVLTNTVMQSGTAKSDLSGFTLTFTEESYKFPPFVKDDKKTDDIDAVQIDQLVYGLQSYELQMSQDNWNNDFSEFIQISVDGTSLSLNDTTPSLLVCLYDAGNPNPDYPLYPKLFIDNNTPSGHYSFTASVGDSYDDHLTFGLVSYEQNQGLFYIIGADTAYLTIEFDVVNDGQRTFKIDNIRIFKTDNR